MNHVVEDHDDAVIQLNAQDDANAMNLDRDPNGTITIHDSDDNSDAIVTGAMEALDDQITEAEFQELVTQNWDRLKAAVVQHRGPGGLVENVIDPMEPMTPQKECLLRDWDFRYSVRSCPNSPTSTVEAKPKKVGPFDVDFMGYGELFVTKELPKYLGDTQELVFSKEEMSDTLLRKLARDGVLDVRIVVKDKIGDPYTIIVEIQGEEEGVRKVKKHLELMVQTKQMRFLSLQSNPRPSPYVKPSGKRKVELYTRFWNKYEKIRDIDFGGIHAKSVASSMWQRHKDRFGPACSPCCPCPLELDFLTSTVIDDMMKKGKFAERPPDIGFSKRFAPKFMPLLRKEYPRETNEDLLTRLIRMWELHLKQQRFGTRCLDTCPCSEGWDFVFNKGGTGGSVAKSHSSIAVSAEPVVPKRKIPLPQISPDNIGMKEYEMLFDTRSPLGFFCATKMGSSGSACSIMSVSPSLKDKEPRLSSGTIVLAVAMGKTGSIWHQVDSHEELKRKYDSFRRHSEGQWMQIRFINTDVKPQHNKNTLAHWTTSSAWRGNPKWKGWAGGAPEIHAVGVNAPIASGEAAGETPVSPIDAEPMAQFLRGNVAGSQDPNLPRGDSRPDVCASDEMPLETSGRNVVVETADEMSNEPSMPRASAESNDELLSRVAPSVPMHTLSSREPGHRTLPKPRPVLKYRSSWSEQKPARPAESIFRTFSKTAKRNAPVVLSWAPDLKKHTILFDGTANAADVLTLGAPQPTATVMEEEERPVPLPSTVCTKNVELLSAISDKSCFDVYRLLQGGADTQPKNVNPKELPQTFAKRIKDSLKHNSSPDAMMKYNDIVLKVILLKIFERARDVMTSSSCLTKWVKYEASISRIENLRLTRGMPVSAGDKFYCEIKIVGEVHKERLESVWAESMDFSGKAGYQFSYNESLPERILGGDERTFVMTFGKTIGSSQRTMVLASQTKQLDDIKSEVAHKEETTIIVDMPQTENLESGRAIVTLRKLRDETKVKIERERLRHSSLLKQVIADMKKFNADERRKASGMPVLDFNLRLPESPRITLLHAAVYLNIVNLVSDLIACGADINARNEKGVSPRKLALRIYETFSKKTGQEKEMKDSRDILKLLGVSLASLDSPTSASDDDSSDVPGIGTLAEVPIEANANEEEDHILSVQVTRESGKPGPGTKIPQYDQHSAPRAGALPVATVEKLTPGKLCRNYRLNEWCIHGQKCYFLHYPRINPEDIVVTEYRPSYPLADLSIKQDFDGNGERCFTTLFRDNAENIYLRAVGGNTLGSNRDGVYWYRTRDDAIDAIERVIAHWQHSYLVRNPNGKLFTSPNRALPATNHNTRNDVIDTKNESESLVFDRLLGANLNKTYSFIMMGAGRPRCHIGKDDWTFKHLRGVDPWINASFTTWVGPRCPSETFSSTGFKGKTRSEDGTHYHSNSKSAQASAFLEFLKFARAEGLLRSLTTTYDSKVLPFWRAA